MAQTRWLTTTSVVVVAMVMALQMQLSMQLPWNHPMRRAVDRINQNSGPFVGLVMAFAKEEVVLLESGHLNTTSVIQLNGRTFYVGSVKDVAVVAVMTGEQIANAAMTMQMLYDTFDITGVVHYGIAGAGNASLVIGDVVVPNYVAYANSWHWINNASAIGAEFAMTFGDFNLPEQGANLLGSIEFDAVEVYTTNTSSNITAAEGRIMQEEFYIATNETWYNLSLSLADIDLKQCLNSTNSTTVCTTEKPVAVFGQIVATSNVFVANQAFRDFCFNKFNFSVSDEETAAVVHTSISNGKPCVVFRGISDMGGGSSTNINVEVDGVSPLSATVTLKTLAAVNSMEMAVQFIELLGTDGNFIRMVK